MGKWGVFRDDYAAVVFSGGASAAPVLGELTAAAAFAFFGGDAVGALLLVAGVWVVVGGTGDAAGDGVGSRAGLRLRLVGRWVARSATGPSAERNPHLRR